MNYFLITLLVLFNQNLFAGDDIEDPQYERPALTRITQYHCINKKNSSEKFFYYDPRDNPGDTSTDEWDCMNKEEDRRIFYNEEKVFSLWDKHDIRFKDNDGDGRLDINQIIEDELEKTYGMTFSADLFIPIKWAPGPLMEPLTLGFAMRPFVDPQTGVSKCPYRKEYNGPDPLLQTLGKILDMLTEGVYLSKKDDVKESDNSEEFLKTLFLISEGHLSLIWFYQEGEQISESDFPSDLTGPIHFFYPPNLRNSHLRRRGQNKYSVISPEGSGLPTHDRKIGCLPFWAAQNLWDRERAL